MSVNAPRLVIAGLSGDSGKTIVSLSLLAALRRQGKALSVYKKGPDYIDAAWLGFAAGRVCRNLDTYLVPEATVRDTFTRQAASVDLALIEGNRGLFDGKDAQGTHSTAGLATLLRAPIVLVVNATKTTRTIAALVHGCMTFDSDVHIAGVVLNKVAGTRHASVIRDAVEHYCGVPVLGVVPKLGSDADVIPGRHLGLVTPSEFDSGSQFFDKLCEIADEYLDVHAILDVAAQAAPFDEVPTSDTSVVKTRARIGYFSDSVFTFYYPENLEGLEREGAELVPISSLEHKALPEIDGLYIGGGFPETHTDRLTANQSLMADVKRAAGNGLPIYAECGGLIYLCGSLAWKGKKHAMAGVFDLDLEISERPRGHGYTELSFDRDNPFFDIGAVVRGHEFHYSAPGTSPDESYGSASVIRGAGLGNGRDALVFNQTLAVYTHLHADGVPQWAPALVQRAAAYRARSGRTPGASTPVDEDNNDSFGEADRPGQQVPAVSMTK